MSVETDDKHDANRPGTRETADRPPGRRRKLLLAALGVIVLAAICIFGIPWVRFAFTTVSTDDAYVNGHVTFVAPRVGGQISRVLVDDNNRVMKRSVAEKAPRPGME